MLDDNQLRQDFFINDDGHVNIRLKFTVEDKEERERIISLLMGNVHDTSTEGGIIIPEGVVVDKMYFHNQDPLTALKSIKEEMHNVLNNVFDSAINANR